MGAREIFARQATLEFFGPGRATRVFRVDTADQVEALDHPAVPGYGEFHPQFSGMTLRRKTAAYADSGGRVTDVTCEYETVEFAAPTPVPNEDPDWTSWSVRYEPTEVEVPVFYRTTVDVNGAQRVTFLNRPAKILETRVIRTVTLNLEGVTFGGQNAIALQQNKIHTIGGAPYRFIAGDLMQRTATKWQATYSWIDDRGTPRLQQSIPVPPFSDQVYQCWIDRNPHSYFQVIPRADPFDGAVPNIIQIRPYAADAFGHLTLPGANKINFDS